MKFSHIHIWPYELHNCGSILNFLYWADSFSFFKLRIRLFPPSSFSVRNIGEINSPGAWLEFLVAPFLGRFWISDWMKASSLLLKGYWYLLIIGRFDAMFIGIPETVLIFSISDVNSSQLCKYNLIQLSWNLSTLIFSCVFICSTSLLVRACSKRINISFCGACCLSCNILVCCYVGLLTCNCWCRFFWVVSIVFVVCCKIWQTYVFALGLNFSSGTWKRLGNLTAPVEFDGVFFLDWSYLFERILFDFPFARILLYQQLNL